MGGKNMSDLVITDSMEIAFNGRLRYVCPYCKEEQKTILVKWMAWGSSEVLFSVKGGWIEPWEEADTRDCEELSQDENCYCPRCRMPLTARDVRSGLRRWLKKLREKNPERYARIAEQLRRRQVTASEFS